MVGVEDTKLSTNKQHSLSFSLTFTFTVTLALTLAWDIGQEVVAPLLPSLCHPHPLRSPSSKLEEALDTAVALEILHHAASNVEADDGELYMYMYIYMCVCVYIYVCVCVCVCVCV